MQIQVTCATSKCKPIRFKFCMRGFSITAQYPTKGRSKISIFNFSHVRYWHPNEHWAVDRLYLLSGYTGMFTKNWHICFTIFTEPNVARMNLRIPNDSAINGNLFNRRLNYTIPISQPRQDIFDMASFLVKLRSARRRRILIVFLHVSTDTARAAAPTDLLNCVRIL